MDSQNTDMSFEFHLEEMDHHENQWIALKEKLNLRNYKYKTAKMVMEGLVIRCK